MKIWSSEYVFDAPWETVTQAVWRKYPNPYKPEVEATDVIDRKVADGKLYTKRLICSRWGLPGWAKKLIGTDKIIYAYEDSELNPDTQQLVMETKNVTMSSRVELQEKMNYKPDPKDPNKTLCIQQMMIAVQGVPLTSFIENYILNCVSSNAFKGREAMEWVINTIDVEVEELMSTCKQSTSEIISSIEEIKDNARKSIGDISNVALKGTLKSIDELQNAKKSIGDISNVALKSIDELQTLTKTKSSLPPI